ncbi:hypothetical protein BH23ACT2_BH23ACT2_28350 [soil metagenome]
MSATATTTMAVPDVTGMDTAAAASAYAGQGWPVDRRHVERAVPACAMVHPELVRDAIGVGCWRPELWLDTYCRATAQAILTLEMAGTVPTMATVYTHLLEGGMADMAARDAVLLLGAGESIDHRYGMLAYWLGELIDMEARALLRRRIVALADQLDRPGGIRRVATALGEEVA